MTSWYDAGQRLTWPALGGGGGFHRMAGRVGPKYAPKAAPVGNAAVTAATVAMPVTSWYDGGLRLTKEEKRVEELKGEIAGAQDKLRARSG